MLNGLLGFFGLGDNQADHAQDAQRFPQNPQPIEGIRTPYSEEQDAKELYNSLMMLTGVQSSHPHGLVIYGGETDIMFHTEMG